MEINDQHDVSGFKSWAITKGIAYLESQITEDNFDEIIDKIVAYFPDKHALVVIKELKSLLGNFYLRLGQREVALEHREIVTEGKQSREETDKERKARILVERNKKSHGKFG